MSESLFSDIWYRVAELKPRLRSHTHVSRHSYRGQLWYVLEDKIAGRYHRFTPAAYFSIAHLNGQKTVQEIWELAIAQLGDEAPSQNEVMQLLGQLYSADLLLSDSSPDTFELFSRFKRQERQQLKQKLISPLAIRLPLYDPEKFLERFSSLLRPVFSWGGACIWLGVVVWALVLAVLNWDELTNNISDTVLTPENLIILWLLFPVVKALHEFGHGFATKVWGGEVHEMGLMFLVFMPIPYVDASASAKFQERYKRVIVGAAGVMVELFVAAICLFIWLNAEQGMVKTITYNVLLIAGVSTVLFNLNPLLRFDGYYIFSDLIEVPNLYTRANKHVAYLFKKYVLGAKNITPVANTPGEQLWMFSYSVLSYAYRMFIMLVIALFIASKYFFIGFILAAWSVANMLVVPLVKGLMFVARSPVLQRQRRRAVLATGAMMASVVALVFLHPVSLWTVTTGVVWLPENAIVRAQESCFIEKIRVDSGHSVKAGELLMQCDSDHTRAAYALAKAKYKEAKIRYFSQLQDPSARLGRNSLGALKDKLNAAKAELDRAALRVRDLNIYAEVDGILRIPLAEDLPGRFVSKGDEIAYVLPTTPATIRVVVEQQAIGLVRKRTESVTVFSPGDSRAPMTAIIRREIPSGDNLLPSRALGNVGGGSIPVDPREPNGLTSLDKIFQFDVALKDPLHTSNYDRRVHIRFDHGKEALAFQWYRSLRQLFLGEFGV